MAIPCELDDNGSWLVYAHLKFQTVRLNDQPFNESCRFLVDTGASTTAICYYDAFDMGLPYEQLYSGIQRRVDGVTGYSYFHQQRVTITFVDANEETYSYEMDILIESESGNSSSGYSILGRDILDLWSLYLEKKPNIRHAIVPKLWDQSLRYSGSLAEYKESYERLKRETEPRGCLPKALAFLRFRK